MTRRGAELAIGTALGLVCALAIAPLAVVGARSLVPGAALRYDPMFAEGVARDLPRREYWDTSTLQIHYPAQRVAADQIRHGDAPLWNPYVGAGAPLLAEAHSAPLSPFLLPFWLRPGETTYSWHLLLRTVVAAAAMFLLARRLGVSRLGAATAAIAYALAGWSAARFDLATEGSAAALLPVIALAGRRAVRGEIGGIVALGAAVAATIYSAHPSLAAIACAAGVGFALAGQPRPAAGWLRAAAGGALGLALAAPVILPFADYLATGWTYKADARLAAELVGWEIDAFSAAPDLLRFGAAAIALAIAAALVSGHAAVRCAAVGVGLFAIAFAVHAAVPAPLGTLVPPRYVLIAAGAGIALAAGRGLDAVLGGELTRRQQALYAAGAAAAWISCDVLTRGGLRGHVDIAVGDGLALAVAIAAAVAVARAPRHRAVAGLAIALATAASLIVSYRRVLTPIGNGVPPPALALPSATPVPVRVSGLGVGPSRAALLPNVASIFGAADVRHAAAIFLPRYVAYMKLVPGAMVGATQSWIASTGSPLLDLLGVTAVVVPRRIAAASTWPRQAGARYVELAANPSAAPRAFVPDTIDRAADASAAARRLIELSRDAALTRRVVIEASDPLVQSVQGARGSVRIRDYRANRVVLEASADRPALVVLTDAHAPGWVARVDGREAPIHPVDVLFRGVVVPAGSHRIVMTYEPAAFRIGALIALVAAAGAGLGFAVARVRARRRQVSD